MLGRSSSTAVRTRPTGMSHRRHPGGGGGAGAAGRSLGGPDRALVVIGVLRRQVARKLLAPSDTPGLPAGVRHLPPAVCIPPERGSRASVRAAGHPADERL